MTLLEYILLATSSLFVILDPIALVPVFLTMTPNDTPAQRVRTARLACLVAAAVLSLFALVGKWIFSFLGITIPAFEMAACVILLLIALDMLQAKPSAVRESREETEAGTGKEDIAITPLAVPLLCGPGAISTTILLHSKAAGLTQNLALFGCIALVCFASYLILRVAALGGRLLSPITMKIAVRLMGLLLAAIAFQFLLNAFKELKGTLF
jgi:multiple antibiotic resistance protein